MSKGKVVIADDAAFIREVLTHLLSKNDFEVVGQATNGEEAVQLVGALNPDVVIMDIVMPVKSGIQATREILETMPDMKVLACSTENSEGMVSQAIEAGCVDFVAKPFDSKSLLATIESVINGAKD